MRSAAPPTSSPVNINGGTLEATSSFATTYNYSVNSPTSGIMVDSGQTLTSSTVFSGSGTLNKGGAGTLVLTSANTYPGGTDISAGSVVVKSTVAAGDWPGDHGGRYSVPAIPQYVPANDRDDRLEPGYDLGLSGRGAALRRNDDRLQQPHPNILYQAGAVFSPAGTGLPGNGQIVSMSNPAVSSSCSPTRPTTICC